MKDQADKKTLDLPDMPEPKKRGRPAKNGTAMSAAERKRISRNNMEKNITEKMKTPDEYTLQECKEILSRKMHNKDEVDKFMKELAWKQYGKLMGFM